MTGAKPSFSAGAMNRRRGVPIKHGRIVPKSDVSLAQLRRDVLEADRLRNERYSVSLVITPLKKTGGAK